MNFFNELDGRIFDFSLAGITDNNYLFDVRPDSFYFQSWAVLLGVLAVVISIGLLWWFKKRRERFLVNKSARKIITKHSKIAFVLWSIYVLFILLRTQGVMYLSMRIFPYLLVSLNFVNIVYALITSRRAGSEKEEEKVEVKLTSSENYAKYLPKKKKK